MIKRILETYCRMIWGNGRPWAWWEIIVALGGLGLLGVFLWAAR